MASRRRHEVTYFDVDDNGQVHWTTERVGGDEDLDQLADSLHQQPWTGPPPDGLPADAVPSSDFYRPNPRRRSSRVLKYGQRWQHSPWTDTAGHVIELMWVGATHELTARYAVYDWSRVQRGRLVQDVVFAVSGEETTDTGTLGRVLGDFDVALAQMFVHVLAVLPSAWACHRLLWDWRWLQRQPNGLAVVATRLQEFAP